MSRARTPTTKQAHPARLREEQMCEVAATGLGRLLCIAFPLMTTNDASVEALRYVRAGVFVSDDQAPKVGLDERDDRVQDDFEIAAEWLYGLSNRYGRFWLSQAAIKEGLLAMQYAMFEHAHPATLPRRVRARMVDSFFDWIQRTRGLSILSLCLHYDRADNIGLVSRMCGHINEAVLSRNGEIMWD